MGTSDKALLRSEVRIGIYGALATVCVSGIVWSLTTLLITSRDERADAVRVAAQIEAQVMSAGQARSDQADAARAAFARVGVFSWEDVDTASASAIAATLNSRIVSNERLLGELQRLSDDAPAEVGWPEPHRSAVEGTMASLRAERSYLEAVLELSAAGDEGPEPARARLRRDLERERLRTAMTETSRHWSAFDDTLAILIPSAVRGGPLDPDEVQRIIPLLVSTDLTALITEAEEYQAERAKGWAALGGSMLLGALIGWLTLPANAVVRSGSTGAAAGGAASLAALRAGWPRAIAWIFAGLGSFVVVAGGVAAIVLLSEGAPVLAALLVFLSTVAYAAGVHGAPFWLRRWNGWSRVRRPLTPGSASWVALGGAIFALGLLVLGSALLPQAEDSGGSAALAIFLLGYAVIAHGRPLLRALGTASEIGPEAPTLAPGPGLPPGASESQASSVTVPMPVSLPGSGNSPGLGARIWLGLGILSLFGYVGLAAGNDPARPKSYWIVGSVVVLLYVAAVHAFPWWYRLWNRLRPERAIEGWRKWVVFMGAVILTTGLASLNEGAHTGNSDSITGAVFMVGWALVVHTTPFWWTRDRLGTTRDRDAKVVDPVAEPGSVPQGGPPITEPMGEGHEAP